MCAEDIGLKASPLGEPLLNRVGEGDGRVVVDVDVEAPEDAFGDDARGLVS